MIRTLFNLYPGEGRKACLFALCLFLWAVGGYGSFTLSEGLFLEHVGAHALPKAYFSIAVAMCVVSSLLIVALGRYRVRQILTGLIFASIASQVVLTGCLKMGASSEGFWLTFKVLSWVLSLNVYIAFWAFLDEYYDLQDAKRLFAFFNAIFFFGDACAGGVIATLLSHVGTVGIQMVSMGAMVCSLPILLYIFRNFKPMGEEAQTIYTVEAPLSKVLKKIIASRFTLYLMLFYFVMQLLAIATEYNTMTTVQRVLSSQGDHALTAFIAKWAMIISLGNMVVGLFLYGRLVKKIGVNNIILVAPLFFLGVLSVWLWRDLLPVAIFGLIAREGMVYTFDDNNLNLLISGVPSKVKNQVRVAIESFFEPVGMLVCSLLLLVFGMHAKWLGFGLSLFALGVVLFLRSHYSRAIFRNLVDNAIRFEKTALDWLTILTKRERKEIELRLLTHLRGADEPTKLLAYEYLLAMGNRPLLPRLLSQFGRLSIPGKLQVIQLLGASPWHKESVVIDQLKRWQRSHPHPAIKSSIGLYFAGRRLAPPERMKIDLETEHLGLRAAAILSLKMSGETEYVALAEEKLSVLLASSSESELCFGIRVLEQEGSPCNCERLLPFLKHASQTVYREAARAIAASADGTLSALAPLLIERLPSLRDSRARLACLTALAKIGDEETVRDLILVTVHFHASERKKVEDLIVGMGSSTRTTLLDLTRDSTVHVRPRLLAGKILGKLSLGDLRTHLPKIVNEEVDRAYFYFYHAHSIQKQIPEYDLTILEDTLMTGYHSILDFIIQLLGVADSIEESEVLSHTLHSQNRKARAHALETFEKTCDPKIFTLMAPLILPGNADKKLHGYLKRGGIPYKLPQLLDTLAGSPSLADQIVSLALKSRLNTPGWQEHLRNKLSQKDEVFHHFAKELLEA